MADNVSVLIRSTLLQVLTPRQMFGRVSSVNSIFVGSSNELGAFESGVAARLLGTVPSVVLGGLASLGVVVTIGVWVPRLRRLGRIDELTPSASRTASDRLSRIVWQPSIDLCRSEQQRAPQAVTSVSYFDRTFYDNCIFCTNCSTFRASQP